MTELLAFLLQPKVAFIYGPLGLVCAAEAWALFYLWRRHEQLHADRLSDVEKMKTAYVELVNNVERTLDVLISVLGKKKRK